MKKLLWFLLILTIAVFIALKIKADPGYVFFSYQDWTVEMPLWLGVIFLFAAFFALQLLWALLKEIILIPAHIQDWYRGSSLARVRRRTARGFIALAEGRWRDAEQLLSKNIDKRHTALLNCLGAAIAAQNQGKDIERDEYLRLAHSYHRHAHIAIGLTQARLQYNQGQLEQSLASLRRLLLISPDHGAVLQLLQNVLLALKDWDALLDLLPALQKNKLIDKATYHALSLKAHVALLKKARMAGSHAVDQYWQALSQNWRDENALLKIYVPHLLSYGEPHQAEDLIKNALKRHWDVDLVRAYGLAVTTQTDKQIKTAETWLKKYPDDPVLLQTLGRLSFRQELWGQAKTYLLKSIEIAPDTQTYLLLGELFAHMQAYAESQAYYQQGLQLACAREDD